MDIHTYLDEKGSLVDGALEELFRRWGEAPEDLRSVMEYAVFSGGKRFRPILSLAAAEALGKPESVVMPVACAVELIHSFSLVHDDLPCLDNDDVRRGKPSCHRKYGVAEAMLAGNALIFLAAEQAMRSIPPGVDPAAVLAATADLCRAAGAKGMIGGQYLELRNCEGEVEEELLRRVHALKTGALIKAALTAAAALCGAVEEERSALEKYGDNVGLAFQITDDILDYGTRPEKVSFAAFHGLAAARQMAQDAVGEALAALDSFDDRAGHLRLLATFLLERSF